MIWLRKLSYSVSCESPSFYNRGNFHHHVVVVAQISLTLSRHFSLSFITLGRSSGQHPVSSHSCWMYVCASRPAFARPCVGVHKSTSLMSLSNMLCSKCILCCQWTLEYANLKAKFKLNSFVNIFEVMCKTTKLQQRGYLDALIVCHVSGDVRGAWNKQIVSLADM